MYRIHYIPKPPSLQAAGVSIHIFRNLKGGCPWVFSDVAYISKGVQILV